MEESKSNSLFGEVYENQCSFASFTKEMPQVDKAINNSEPAHLQEYDFHRSGDLADRHCEEGFHITNDDVKLEKVGKIDVFEQFIDDEVHEKAEYKVNIEEGTFNCSVTEVNANQLCSAPFKEEMPKILNPPMINSSTTLDQQMNDSEPTDLKQYICHKSHIGDYSVEYYIEKHIQNENASSLESNQEVPIKFVILNTKKYKCDLCEFVTHKKDYLEKHVDDVHLNMKHKRQICRFVSTGKYYIKEHMEVIREYKCDLCDFGSDDNSKLQRHIKSSHLKMQEYKCHLCEFITSVKSSLRRHVVYVHSNIKKHKCDSCSYETSIKNDLRKHIDSVHLNIRKHKCPFCDYAATYNKTLQMHIKTIHLKIKEHKCHLCDYATNLKANLQTHIDSVHLKMKNQECHLCDFVTYRREVLKRHVNSVHLNIKKHKCHSCDFAANQKHTLSRHIKSVHLKINDHKCRLCEYKTNKKDNLKRHMNSVHKYQETQVPPLPPT